jgi:predicted nucleotidyltransferase
MNNEILESLRRAKAAFPGVSFIIFGSQAREDGKPGNDLDVCAVFPFLNKDPFEHAYEVRVEIHKYLDVALDVVVVDERQFSDRCTKSWTLEAAIHRDGIVI